MQARRYLNPSSQAAIQHMLSEWACVQRSTVESDEQDEDDVNKHQYFPRQPRLPKYCSNRCLIWHIDNKTLKEIYTRYTAIFFILFFVTYIEYFRFINLLLCGDIETGPFNWWKSISFYYWNLNALLALNREKFHPIEVFVVSNNIDIFCIPEMFLDSSVYGIYNGLNINDYTLIGKDHPSNTNSNLL